MSHVGEKIWVLRSWDLNIKIISDSIAPIYFLFSYFSSEKFMAKISKLALIQTLGIIANWYANDTLMRCYRLQIYKAWTGGPWITAMCTVRGSLLWNSFNF